MARPGLCAIACAMILILGLAGCAVVRIQTASKDDVEVRWKFGIVSVEIRPGAEAMLVESTSFGAINGFEGFALGYHDATMTAFSGDRCQLVLWIKTKEQLEELNGLLRERTDVCVVGTDQTEREKP